MRNVARRTISSGASFFGTAGGDRAQALQTVVTRVVWATALAVALAATSGCEGISHENIDRWVNTQKGPDKLRKALRDSDLDADVRAHAGRNLVHMDEMDNVLEALEGMAEGERAAVLDKMARRLWEDARIEGDMTMPTSDQVGAKDALFDLRKFATGEVLNGIDDNLVDWLTGGYYAARARQGRFRGSRLVRGIGPRAASKLLRVAKSIVAAPADDKGRLPKIEDPLLIGLAATGSPETVDFLLNLINLDRNDKTLAQREHKNWQENEHLRKLAYPRSHKTMPIR